VPDETVPQKDKLENQQGIVHRFYIVVICEQDELFPKDTHY